jgi:hypothetical protein
MIVLDSWDAIVGRHVGHSRPNGGGFPSREDIEQIAITQMSKGLVFLLFVAERREAGQLKYLVDGVVSMERQVCDDWLERLLRLEKLRGTRIAEPSHPFSLEDGRFRSIEPMQWLVRSTPTGIEGEPNHLSGLMWPGSIDYASHFGLLPSGKLTLIERDPDVPFPAMNLMLNPLLADVLERHGRILHVPPFGHHTIDVSDLYKDRGSKETFLRPVRILGPLRVDDSDDLSPAVLPLPAAAAGSY